MGECYLLFENLATKTFVDKELFQSTTQAHA